MSHIIFESPADQAGFVMLPNVVLMDETLSVPARLLYGLLLHHAREGKGAYPGQKRLSVLMRVSERQVRDYLRELEAAMLIRTQRQGSARTNLYVLLALGLRAKRMADRNSASGPDRNSASGRDRNSGSDKEDLGEVDPSGGQGARASAAVKFGGKPVNVESWEKAQRVLAEFNSQAGMKVRPLKSSGEMSEGAKRVYRAVNGYPDITEDEFADIIRRTLASRWWGSDDPNPGVVFGQKVFEDNITRDPAGKKGSGAKRDALNDRLREIVMRRRGVE